MLRPKKGGQFNELRLSALQQPKTTVCWIFEGWLDIFLGDDVLLGCEPKVRNYGENMLWFGGGGDLCSDMPLFGDLLPVKLILEASTWVTNTWDTTRATNHLKRCEKQSIWKYIVETYIVIVGNPDHKHEQNLWFHRILWSHSSCSVIFWRLFQRQHGPDEWSKIAPVPLVPPTSSI